ncbi:hypothetical protein FACS189468_3090 [Spirochaetia bacterium]|nr:hypothetical protein FACS189468_3090 [Spirochaetia bacterium]
MRSLKWSLLFMAYMLLFTGVTAVFAGGSKEEVKTEETVKLPGPPYYVDGEAGEGKVIAVFKPEGNSLSADEEKYLAVIQQQLSAGFSKYSRMQQSDEQNMERIKNYQQQTLSGDYSDDTGLSVGNMIAAGYAVNGNLTKLPNNKFQFSLTITDSQTGVQVPGSSYTVNVTLWDITNFIAVNNALAELLPKMDVTLTESGRANLTAVSSAAKAQAELDRALAAQTAGDFIGAMFYGESASESDATLLRAKELADDAFANIQKTAGSVIVEDYKRRQAWQKNLTDFEQFFLDHPPFTLYFDPVARQSEITNYTEGTADFTFKVSLRQTDLSAMQKVMDKLIKGLKDTKKRTTWQFEDWPVISAHSTKQNQIPTEILKNYQSYRIVAGFYCDDTQLATVDFDMYFQLALGSFGKINFDSIEQRTINFKNIDLNKLTELGGEQLLSVQIVSINGKDVNQSNQDDYIRTIATTQIPGKRSPSLSKRLRTIPELPEETEARIKREAAMNEKERLAAERQREREIKAAGRQKLSEKFSLTNVRFGINGVYAYPSSIMLGGEFGFRSFTLEGNYRFLLDNYNEDFDVDITSAFGGSIGVSAVNPHTIWTFALGASDYKYETGDNVFIPNAQIRLNIIPMKWGPSIRLGYTFEFGFSGMGGMTEEYFSRPGGITPGSFMIKNSFIAGFGFWI